MGPWPITVLLIIVTLVPTSFPVIPFFFDLPRQQIWAFVLTALTALAFGAMKSRYTLKGPLRSAIEFLLIISVGTAVGALVGILLHAA